MRSLQSEPLLAMKSLKIRLCKHPWTHKDRKFIYSVVFNFFSQTKTKVDGDDSSNDWWRSDHEEELIRLISTPIVDAITKIDDNNREE